MAFQLLSLIPRGSRQPAPDVPQLRGEDFSPWINEDDARKKGLSPADYATQQAALWQKGLGEWGQSGERIQKLRDAADVVIYPRQQRRAAGVDSEILCGALTRNAG